MYRVLYPKQNWKQQERETHPIIGITDSIRAPLVVPAFHVSEYSSKPYHFSFFILANGLIPIPSNDLHSISLKRLLTRPPNSATKTKSTNKTNQRNPTNNKQSPKATLSKPHPNTQVHKHIKHNNPYSPIKQSP